ncbi:MAG: Nif3-like dinuclear metal center hexameric protein [Anaerovoracaceae bacterium]|jgi:dinuclear metal center YbgI/SA1388 family protein
MQFSQLRSLLEEIAPPHLTEDWDNSGLQINAGRGEVRRVLVALELTREVLAEAEEGGFDLVVTHHPLLFHSLRCIDADDGQIGEYVCRAVRAGLSVWSAHLTFDNAPLGNNTYLAKLIALEDTGRPAACAETVPFFVGSWPRPLPLKEACRRVATALRLPPHALRVVDGGGGACRRVGLCTGAGGEFVDLACREDCDLLLTGEVRLHEAQAARARGLSLIDAGHYGTEKIFAENFSAQLRARAGEALTVRETTACTNPFTD